MLLLSGPNLSGNEMKYVSECIETGWVSSVGSYVDKFEKMTAESAGSKYAVATSSGTAALHIALLLLGVRSEDLVIVPNVTFVATLNAVKYTGASPVLIDANPEDWQMDLRLLKEFLETQTEIRNNNCYHKKTGKRIPVIMPVHVLGNMCDMDQMISICSQYHLTILEDSTEALGSYYKGKHSGTFGKLGTFSYNGNKIITTGGGGMIVTDDEALAKKAKHLTTQAKADSFEYFHDETGYNYRLVNISAAIGVAQMEQLPQFLARKKDIISFYTSALDGVGDITFQKVHQDVNPNWWMPTIRTEKQREVLQVLNASNMQSRPLWIPMNQLPMFKNEIYFNVADRSSQLYKTCLSIPCSTNISDAALQSVADKIKAVYA